jgi:subtilisin family serine protease
MSKLDPQLEFLLDGGTTVLESTGNVDATLERFGIESPARRPRTRPTQPADAEVTVLVQYAGDPDALEGAGLNIRSISGDVVTGTIALSALRQLEQLADVERVEAARAMHIDLDLSVVESRANLVHTGPPGRRGAGVIVGICDSGCDFTHPSFRRGDGTSRILFIWAQGLAPQGSEASPAGFGYGVEYTNAQINAALASANPFNAVRHRDPGLHGTHVTGIAAGDGSAPGQGRPGGTFVGVAPEADIIVVANASNGAEGLGTSANTLDAVNYIYQRAGTILRPCVVNMSLGDNLGPHDGTSLLERGLDNLLGGPGRAFVKSAGNAGSAACHAEGTLGTGATQDVRFNQPAGDNGANQIDVWYRGTDTFRVSVIDPAGNSAGPVNVGAATTFTLPGGNTVRIDHRNNDAFNGDRRVFMTFAPGGMGTMRAGDWTVRLTGIASPGGGRFDAWIQRGDVVPGFLAPHESAARTISTPGTAREVITAANYVTRGAGVGSLSSSSSRGPTRDGRAAPTVAAPGEMIMSASAESSGGDPYRTMGGTSMAAPHVTGTIALMFQKNSQRTQAEIKACLESTARSDGQTGPVPNTAWGAGKLDSNAAVNCVPGPGLTRSIVVTCQRSVVTPCVSVLTTCPSVPTTTCPASVIVLCQSVPQVTCGQPSVINVCPSVPTTTCPASVVVLCQSVPQVTCQQSVINVCVSVPRTTCPVVSVAAACPSLAAACPSVIDGCPSTPGGCVQSVACGLQSVACGVQSVACAVQSVACGVQSVACGGLGGLGGGITRPGEAGRSQGRPLPEGWDESQSPAQPRPGLPAQGYFDYDENWFDKDGE